MQVELIGMTKMPGDIGTLDDLIFVAQRQCYFNGYVGEQLTGLLNAPTEEKHKVMRHVIQSGHCSTVEHASFTFAIGGVSRACSHQLVRHRMASFSQQSQRYTGCELGLDAEQPETEYVIPYTICKTGKEDSWKRYRDAMSLLKEAYAALVADGIPKEDARYLLPNAWKTNIVVTMNVRSLSHFFGERLCSRAQWEIRELARLMSQICIEQSPLLFKELSLGRSKCIQLGYCPEQSKGCYIMPKLSELQSAYASLNKSDQD